MPARDDVATRARGLLASVSGGLLAELPVTVRFWDGSELPAAAGGPPAGVLHVRREAIGYLVRKPNQLGLARAYVAGTLDLDGDLEPLLDLRRELERAPGMTVRQRLTAAAQAVIATGPRALRTAVPAAEAVSAATCTRSHETAARSDTTTTSPTRSTGSS